MIKDLIMNITIIISYLFLIGQISKYIHPKDDYTVIYRRLTTQINAGMLFGILGIILMLFSIKIHSFVVIDLRHIAIVIAAVFFGSPAALVSAFLISVGRLFLLGGVSSISLLPSLGMFLVGVACAILTKLSIQPIIKSLIMNVVSLTIITIYIYVNAQLFSQDEIVLIQFYSINWITSLIGGVFVFYVSNYVFESNQAYFELQQTNSRLQSLLSNLNSGILVESQNRKVALVDDTFYTMFQTTEKDISIGADASTLDEEANNRHYQSKFFVKRVRDIVSHKELVTNEELHLVDGRIFERDYIPIFSKHGDFHGHLWSFRDVTERKKNEEETKTSKEKFQLLSEQYQSVVENVKEVIFQTDKTGRWTFLNQSWTEITGFSLQDTLGENFLQYVHPEDHKRHQQLFLPLMKQEFCTYEIRCVTKHGGYRWVEVFARLTVDKNGNVCGTSGTLNDITDRREMEKKLIENEQKYKSLFENNQNTTYILDTNGHFTALNAVVEELTGYSVENLLHSSFSTLISKEYLQATLENFETILTGKPATSETALIHKNGNKVYLNLSSAPIIIEGKIVGVIGVARDITKQKMAEQQLKLSEERYRSLINLSPEVIFVHSASKIEFINDKALSFIGAKDYGEIVGKSVYDFLHEDDKKIAAYNLTLMFSGRDHHVHGFKELRFVRFDQKIITADVGATMIEYNGEPAILGIIHDITKKKEVEEKLKKASDLLNKQAKLDGLIEIPNRRYYDETLEKELQQGIRNGKPLSLIMLDIDHFKAYNDTYGHQEGDRCLKEVAYAIKASLHQPTYFMARYGGEEFSVILPETDKEEAMLVADTIRSSVEALHIPHIHSKVKPVVTISLGVATTSCKDSFITSQQLIVNADKALYISKQNGRNQANVFSNKI